MSLRQNAHLTFKANKGQGRHGWLRLTPAYSYRLVHDALQRVPGDAIILDPFSGTGTTGLAAVERSHECYLVDLNPFLHWLAVTKIRNYTHGDLVEAQEWAAEIAQQAPARWRERSWCPPLHNIDRWWTSDILRTLAAIRAMIEHPSDQPAQGLLSVAFGRTMIEASNAAFNHQSMSFKSSNGVREPCRSPDQPDGEAARVLDAFMSNLRSVVQSAAVPLPGQARVMIDDARQLGQCADESVDFIYSSPPYVNRMSYIRELRPYMYWLGYLNEAKQAGELDWRAIGGTWGSATSRVAAWEPDVGLPLDGPLTATLESVAQAHPRNGPLLARYIHKYFYDMWQHFEAAHRVLRPGGRAVYVVGNSTFYGTLVPAERWYGLLLEAAGFEDVEVERIRKRNSKRELFEFEVAATRG